jgi:O-antigen/teichoic acid export membrane protein
MALRLNLWLSICLFCLCALGLLFSDGSSKLFLIFLALLCVPFIALEATHNGIIKGLEKPAHAEFAKQVIQPVLMGAVLMALISTKHITASSAILSMILATAGCALFSVTLYHHLRPPVPHDVMAIRGGGILFTSLASFSAIALINNFNAQIGILILGILDQNTETASLRIAERAGQLVAMPLAIVNLMIAPRIVTAFQSQDIEQLNDVARRAALYSFGLTLPATVALLFYGDWLITISFGEAYVERALPAVIIIAVSQTLGAFLGSVWPLLTMTGHEKRALGGLALAFALNVLVCLWLAPTLGATGAALGSAVSLVVCKSMFSREIKRLLNVNSRAF